VEKGLSPGEVVALELPKEELARLAKSPLVAHTNKVEASAGRPESVSKTGGAGKSPPATGPRTR
jgi:hypothetical protein